MQRSLVAAHPVTADAMLICLAGEQPRGGRLLAGAGWAPAPRCCHGSANAVWTLHYCSVCQRHRATLATTAPVPEQGEIVVDWSPFPDQDHIAWPYEVTFGGGARSFGDQPKVAGAGASL